MPEWAIPLAAVVVVIGLVVWLLCRAINYECTKDTTWTTGTACTKECGFRSIYGIFFCCPRCGSERIHSFVPMRCKDGKLQLRSEVKDD